MGTDREVLAQAVAWKQERNSVALATVIRTWGSAPRAAGSYLAVKQDGSFVGSVSGGCVENAVVDEALRVMASGEATRVTFGVTDEIAWSVGLACGGQVEIRIEPVLNRHLLVELLTRTEGRGAVVLATDLDDGESQLLRPEAPEAGDPALHMAALRALASDSAGVQEVAGRTWFLRPFNPPPRILVVGAVHVAQSLSVMAAAAGFDLAIVDPRTSWATPERFPRVRLVADWPEVALRELSLDARTAVVTLTHDPKLDDPALVAALRAPVFYIGALGSRRTHAQRIERLRAQGLGDDALRRIRAPVGLDLGARTPGEIAVAILAEILGALRT